MICLSPTIPPPEDFFKNGLPLANAGFKAIVPTLSDGKVFYGIPVRCLWFISKHFNKQQVFRENRKKFLNIKNGCRTVIRTLMMNLYHGFTGFYESHTANSFLKQSFEEIWAAGYEDLMDTVKSRFRDEFGLSQWVVHYWQICRGNFEVRPARSIHYYSVSGESAALCTAESIVEQQYKIICINDDVKNNVSDDDFDAIKNTINHAFETKLSEKCMYEK